MAGYIFGGDTGMTYDQLQRKRRIADAMMRSSVSGAPQSFGEGLTAIGQAIAGKLMERRLDKAERKIPSYARGTPYARGGVSLVGEQGPELVNLPRGAQVVPATQTAQVLGDAGQMERALQTIDDIDPSIFFQMPLNEAAQNLGVTPKPGDAEKYDAMDYEGRDNYWREMFSDGFMDDSWKKDLMDDAMREGRKSPFMDDQAVEVAQLAGIGPDDMSSSMKNDVQRGAFAYSSIMEGLENYRKTFQKTGGTVLPGKTKDSLDVSRRALQMQMKELYNLGVLNGPDLMLMDQMLVDPTSISNNVLDLVGVSDLEERVNANIDQVKEIMENLIAPKLKAAGINIDELVEEKELSDEEFLKELGF